MKADTIKAHAALKGYALASESETKLVFYKADRVISVDSAINRITQFVGGKLLFNMVSEETIDAVAKFLLK